MKIDITFVNIKHFDIKNIQYWIWYFRKFKFVKGFQVRIFGIHFKVIENSGTEKLIKIWRKMPS